jgi:hypothetical protein
MTGQLPAMEELERLHSTLTPGERDELLQCLLTAAPRGGEAMVKLLEESLLCHAAEELLREHGDEPLGSGGSAATAKG